MCVEINAKAFRDNRGLRINYAAHSSVCSIACDLLQH